jgi:hypothetical protein
LVGEPEGKRSLGRTRFRCEDNIKLDLKETGCDGVDLNQAQVSNKWWAVVNTVMNHWVT